MLSGGHFDQYSRQLKFLDNGLIVVRLSSEQGLGTTISDKLLTSGRHCVDFVLHQCHEPKNSTRNILLGVTTTDSSVPHERAPYNFHHFVAAYKGISFASVNGCMYHRGNQSGQHLRILERGDVVSCFVDFIEQCIAFSINGQFECSNAVLVIQ